MRYPDFRLMAEMPQSASSVTDKQKSFVECRRQDRGDRDRLGDFEGSPVWMPSTCIVSGIRYLYLMGQKDRTDRYKTVGAGVGLVRVEVLVPKEDRQAVIETARQLREARQSLSGQANTLYDEALSRFKTRCFWNSNPPKSEDGLAAIHDRLQAYGDMEAWRLAARIRKVMRHATR